MFDSTPAAKMENECVVVIGNVIKQSYFGFNDLLHVAAHAFRIVIAFAVDHDVMRRPANLEIDLLEVAALDRRIVKNIEVLSAKVFGWPSTGGKPVAICHPFAGLMCKVDGLLIDPS